MNILLHACCAPCATWCIKKLKSDSHDITLFYDNPNIYPEAEREKRLSYLKFLADYHHLSLLVGKTPHEEWLEYIRGYEREKEHGKRCEKCFEMNLKLAENAMIKAGCDGFTTSLTVSRFKKSAVIFKTTDNLKNFVRYDFKKEAGFEKSCRLAKELNLYRQNYCGCEFSNYSNHTVNLETV